MPRTSMSGTVAPERPRPTARRSAGSALGAASAGDRRGRRAASPGACRWRAWRQTQLPSSLLDGVVEDAPPQRGHRPGRVVLDRAGQEVVEAGEAGRAVDEVGDQLRLVRVDAGQHVDQHDAPHQLGGVGVERQRGQPAERHAHHGARRRAPGPATAIRHVGGVVRRRPSGPSRAPVGVAVAGQVDGDQRPAEGQGDRVPGVGVLGAAVQQHQLRRPRRPTPAR